MSSPLFFFLVVHFLSYPRMCFSQGNPQKLKYWSMAEIWDMAPVSSVGTYVAQFGNSAIGEAECQTCVSKSPLS